uniref:ATPase_AAA_core domain-containing protein n=1 Tax=Steinernema glaseri TaxID=37863 RepID=A0A1I8A4I8_9BILA
MNVAPMRVLMEKANAIIEEQTKEKDRQIDSLLSDDFSPHEPCDSALWVDKYSPKGYAELLSDDGINRMLLTWVKMWDECAFKKKPPSVEHLSELEQRNLELESTLKPARPRLRTAMLYGQPGMGKTTLAKIIARQAGYNPIDVNASGDRKVDYLKGLIEGVVRSVGSVNSMQENVTTKPNLNIPYQICENEKLWLDRAALQRVVEGCFGDIRSCLNTLQMLKSKQAADTTDRITVAVVNEAMNRQGIGRSSMFDHGLYHNYLGKNVSMSAVKRAIAAFETLDLYETRIHKTQNYELMRYMSTITISVHLAVASHTKKKLEFPALEQQLRERMRQSVEVLSAVRSRPEVFKYSRSCMILDILPQAVIIAQPPLKPESTWQSLIGTCASTRNLWRKFARFARI